MAGAAARRRSGLPRERRLDRRARPRRGAARSRRGAARGAPLRGGDRGVREARAAVAATDSVELEVRALAGEAWARMQQGEVRDGDRAAAASARELVEEPASPTSTAPTSSSGSASAATSSRASRPRSRSSTRRSQLAERSELPCDLLRSDILDWRSRCHRRQRDFEAAREDVERALELAQALDDRADDGARLLPGVARRRAHGPLGARRATTRSGRRSSTRSSTTSGTSAGC